MFPGRGAVGFGGRGVAPGTRGGAFRPLEPLPNVDGEGDRDDDVWRESLVPGDAEDGREGRTRWSGLGPGTPGRGCDDRATVPGERPGIGVVDGPVCGVDGCRVGALGIAVDWVEVGRPDGGVSVDGAVLCTVGVTVCVAVAIGCWVTGLDVTSGTDRSARADPGVDTVASATPSPFATEVGGRVVRLAVFASAACFQAAPCSSVSRRTTGGSTVDDADLTNSPILESASSTCLLGTPNSLASSWTRTFATVLLLGRSEPGPGRNR